MGKFRLSIITLLGTCIFLSGCEEPVQQYVAKSRPVKTVVVGNTEMADSRTFPAVVDAIQNLLDVHTPESRNVATSVCGHSVIIKKVSLPVMTREELEQSIQWEAEQ